MPLRRTHDPGSAVILAVVLGLLLLPGAINILVYLACLIRPLKRKQ